MEVGQCLMLNQMYDHALTEVEATSCALQLGIPWHTLAHAISIRHGYIYTPTCVCLLFVPTRLRYRFTNAGVKAPLPIKPETCYGAMRVSLLGAHLKKNKAMEIDNDDDDDDIDLVPSTVWQCPCCFLCWSPINWQ